MNENIKNLLTQLINIKSVSKDINAIEEIILFVEKYFSIYENVIIKKYNFNSKPSIIIQNFDWMVSDIILSWHLDVVPEAEENQFDIKIEDWKIFARWAWDMKSWVAIMMEIMKEVLEKKYNDKKICLMITTDEEVWGENWVKKLVDIWYSSSIVIIPDSWSLEDIVIAEKWVIHMEIEVNWKSCHASRPWLWENAIENIYKIYNEFKLKIEEKNKLKTKKHWATSVNLTKINWWNALNTIPEYATGWFDIRFTEKFSWVDEIIWIIKDILNKYNSKIINYYSWDLLFTNKNNINLKKYISSYKKIIWTKPNIVKEHWASDWRYFASKWIPVILQRPTCKNIHSKNEYVEIDAIDKIYKIYKDFIGV